MKKKFGKGKRYGDFLSVLLVITIIAILTLVGYLVFKVVNTKTIETNASAANDEFLTIAKENSKLLRKVDEKSQEDDEEEDYDPSSLQNFIGEPNAEPEPTTNNSQTVDRSKIKKAYLGNYEIKGSINIPKTNCNYPILGKVTPDSLKKSVAILDIVSNPDLEEKAIDLNVPGSNAFILGHNYLNGQFFSNNDKLAIGDIINITDQFNQTVTYTIYNMFYTTSEDTSFLGRDIEINTREITLQTCNDNSSQRLIILAKDN